ncbi:MAG: AbrB/MazE/SpoVT family DNA-binding domain-containing protein [Chloracidobacterium sp.]|nr:AbrB/MazE/SpoVT family DNA-binding domain-containing protein [Chloracidobacterium sp.]
MATRLTTWGNGVGVRIPRELMVSQGLEVGQEVELVPTPDGVMIRTSVPRFNLADLASQMIPGNQPEIIDFGAPVGEES